MDKVYIEPITMADRLEMLAGAIGEAGHSLAFVGVTMAQIEDLLDANDPDLVVDDIIDRAYAGALSSGKFPELRVAYGFARWLPPGHRAHVRFRSVVYREWIDAWTFWGIGQGDYRLAPIRRVYQWLVAPRELEYQYGPEYPRLISALWAALLRDPGEPGHWAVAADYAEEAGNDDLAARLRVIYERLTAELARSVIVVTA